MEFSVSLLDVVYIALIVLLVVLIYAACQVAGILKDIRITTEKMREVADIVHRFALKPVMLGMRFYRKIQRVMDMFDGKSESVAKKRKKKKKG